MSTTKLPNVFITPEPPSSSEVTSALNSKANSSDLNSYVTLTSTQTISGSKTISSDLNLQPSSSSANTGGKINFHYNQSSSATSSIYESSSGRIKLDCDLWMDNYVYSNINLSGGGQIRFSNIDASTNSSERRVFCFSDKGATALGGLIFLFTSGNADHSARLRVHNNGAYNDLGIAKKSNGDVYTFAPTPATNDNSTKLATTAFVNNRLPYTTGTWTPELKGSSTAGAFTYVERTGKYIKIGRLVFIYGYITFSACTTVPEGIIKISGLPFKCMNGSGTRAISIWGRCAGLDGSSLQKITGFFVIGNSTELSARVFIPWSDSALGISAFNEATWSTSDANGVHVKITAQTYTGVGISFGGCYMTD